MGNYNLRRLSCPDLLRSIDPGYLEELLMPHRAFFAAHGVALPLGGREAPLKYLALVQLFVAPPTDMPLELLDALYYVDKLATPLGIEALDAAAEAAGIMTRRYIEIAPAEIVLKLWLNNRSLVERVYAEMAIRRLRSFEYFQSESADVPRLDGLSDSTIRALENELNECFHARRRGRYARIFVSKAEGSVWLYISHGGMLRREGTIEEHGPSSICYRPEVYDAVVFVQSTGELGIHAGGQWETRLYQRLCGKHLFGDEDLFVGTAKYTLDPLLEYGKAALQCIDVPGMEWVRLTGLSIVEPTEPPLITPCRSDDLFASWQSSRLQCSPGARLVSASFRIKIVGCRTPQRVTVRPSNRAEYPQDADQPWIEKWFERRGFIRRKGGANDESLESVLAVA